MRIKTSFTCIGALALGAFALVAGGNLAEAQSGKSFFKGKRMTMYIGYSAGGGYDRYARTLGRHMGRQIPGNPKFTAKNYTGAGSMRLANSLYTTFKQDGTNVATIGRTVPLEHLTGNPKAKFNANKFHWIGSINQETSVCAFWHTSGIKTVDDLFNKNPIVGGTGVGSGTAKAPRGRNPIVALHLSARSISDLSSADPACTSTIGMLTRDYSWD